MSTSVTSVTNHFPSAENGFSTSTSASVSSGATTVQLNSVAGYDNGEVVVFVIDPTDATKKQTFTGIVDTAGTQITNVVWTAGTNQTHALGATVVDYATATHISMISKGLSVSLNQDGTLKTNSVTTANITDGNVTNAKIATGVITNDKRSSTNWEYRRAAPSGTTDTTGTSFIDIITFTDLNIPSWATQAVFHWHGSAYTITAVTDSAVQLLLGSGDNTEDERLSYNSYPVNSVYGFSAVSVVTLNATGTQSLKLQCKELAGSGATRFITSSVWTVYVEYF